jgi:nucleoside 2-deoxyribosyltransferase
VPRPRCYVASPLGFTDGGRAYYEATYLPALAQVVEVVDPWSLAQPGDEPLAIGRRNAEAIRACDVLAAYLEGQEPDSGTVAEVGYAAGLGKPCFGLRTDLRRSGDGTAVNLQVEAFIVESGGRMCASLPELVEALRG